MDIEKIWQQQKLPGDDLPNITSISQLKAPQQQSPLKRMKWLLKVNMIWALVISVAYIAIACFEHYWQIRALFVLLLGFNFWSVWSGLKLYRSIDARVTAANLLAELIRNRDALKQWIAVQSRMALFIYPFSAAAGFLFGGVIGSGKPVDVFIGKPIVIIALVVCMIVLTPLAHLATKWMFKRGFGKLQTHLDTAIAQLSNPQ
jgi:cation transporter-like permease